MTKKVKSMKMMTAMVNHPVELTFYFTKLISEKF